MSTIGSDVAEASVLDLFAGSGALGLEALSRGAEHCVFVERSRKALGVLRANIELVGATDRARVVAADAFRFLGRLGEEDRWDLALADPPYSVGAAERVVEGFLERPFARELWVEHRTGELADRPEFRSRRYGDTTLTRVRRADDPD